MKKKLLLFAAILITKATFARNIVVQGTIGKYPIVMTLSTDDEGTCRGRYFYKSLKHDIYLHGTLDRNTVTLSTKGYNGKPGKDDIIEAFSLILDGKDSLNGTWKDRKGKELPVKLHQVNIDAIKNPFAGLPSVREISDDPYEYIRTSEMKIVQDSVTKVGPYTLCFIHIDHSAARIMQFTDGLNIQVLNKINALLEDKLIYYAMQDFSCDMENYYVTGPFINNSVFSTNIFSSRICNDYGLDVGDDPVNLDLRTGNVLKLEDILYISDIAAPSEEVNEENVDAWIQYGKVYAAKIMELLRRLHPQEMQTPADSDGSCNYNTPDVWDDAKWFLTRKGIYISPVLLHAQGPCGDPDWSEIPFCDLKKYRKPKSGIVIQ